VTDGFAADTEEVGEFGFAEAELASPQGAEAEGLQDFIGELSSIG
jgi:hypothetical protein